MRCRQRPHLIPSLLRFTHTHTYTLRTQTIPSEHWFNLSPDRSTDFQRTPLKHSHGFTRSHRVPWCNLTHGISHSDKHRKNTIWHKTQLWYYCITQLGTALQNLASTRVWWVRKDYLKTIKQKRMNFLMFDSEDYIYALADALIQSNLQCIQGFVFLRIELRTFVSSKHFMFMFLMATLREQLISQTWMKKRIPISKTFPSLLQGKCPCN